MCKQLFVTDESNMIRFLKVFTGTIIGKYTLCLLK